VTEGLARSRAAESVSSKEEEEEEEEEEEDENGGRFERQWKRCDWHCIARQGASLYHFEI